MTNFNLNLFLLLFRGDTANEVELFHLDLLHMSFQFLLDRFSVVQVVPLSFVLYLSQHIRLDYFFDCFLFIFVAVVYFTPIVVSAFLQILFKLHCSFLFYSLLSYKFSVFLFCLICWFFTNYNMSPIDVFVINFFLIFFH